ncbi:MAG: 2-oxoacid:ferredoxin oxidoreductase subunit beta [Gammaproteobacteria bacterium]|nr:2-oxoacid:ferredoxin oxidoreductase subunit beta [Gammaproteobacteria bacterium]
MHEQPILSAKDFQSPQTADWCASCGDFGVLKAIQQALAASGRAPDQVAVFGGIGCSGKTPYYLISSGIHTLHGRVLPFALGAKLANPALTVLAVGGDGDGLSIGGAHFINAARRNIDITYILYNNGVYGLTKGQAAPTLPLGEQLHSMAMPSDQAPLNPLRLALASGYSWLGRGYAYEVSQLAELLTQAIAHPGTAILEVLQPCPTYNRLQTREWYSHKDPQSGLPRLYPLAEDYQAVIPPDANKAQIAHVQVECFARLGEWGERIPLGVFLADRSRPSYPMRGQGDVPIADVEGYSRADLRSLYEQFSV